MDLKNIAEAKSEAVRFLKRVKEFEEKQKIDECAINGSIESGAVGRASLDLTRSLAKMRKPYIYSPHN